MTNVSQSTNTNSNTNQETSFGFTLGRLFRKIFSNECNNDLVSMIQTFSDDNLPITWERSTNKQNRFLLPEHTDEYRSVLAFYNQTIHDKCSQIIKIERIQNARCFNEYLTQKREFEKRLKKNTEKILYHGCAEHAANSIIETNFNKSFSGVNGAIYGIGVYFSSKADYCHGYTVPNQNGERCMFLARVLLGKRISANRSMKTPPVGVDSAVDANDIVVLYHDAQAYPEYLITYR